MIADVDEDMRVFQEEIFGPVLVAMPFDDEAEAIRLANATPYGLAAYVWTNDIRRAHRVAHAIDTGMCWINSQNVRDLRTPFGGVKASGIGREGGDYAFDFYCETEIVHVALGSHHIPRLGLGDEDERSMSARLSTQLASKARAGDAAVRHRARRLRRAARDRPRGLGALLRRAAGHDRDATRTDDAVYLRGWEERQHHSLVLRQGAPATAAAAARASASAREDDLDLLAAESRRRGG